MLTASQAVNGSGAAYAADYSNVLDVLQTVTSIPDALTNSFLAQQIQTQTDTLASKQDETIAAISALALEVRQNTRAVA